MIAYKLGRNMRGELNAESIIPLKGDWIIKIHTSKGDSGYLSTAAQVGQAEKLGVFDVFKFEMFNDYSKVLARSKCRATAKAVAGQHECYVTEESVAALKAEIAIFYGVKFAAKQMEVV
jgi:hypothetical protein